MTARLNARQRRLPVGCLARSAATAEDAVDGRSTKRPKIPLLTSHEIPKAMTPTVSSQNNEFHEFGGSTMLLTATSTIEPTIVQPQTLKTTFRLRFASDTCLPLSVSVNSLSEK